ncbi:MAG: DUF3800 domain-containing protein [Epsilonproteobacteria bacterium]|nr:DUF3800 domain-containing protein [Campylobacterota bacterium]
MNIDIYCDETLTDLFTSKKSEKRYMLLGGVWINRDIKEKIKQDIKSLRKKYNCWGEIKWVNVSPSKKEFYLKLIELFFNYGEDIRFRCIVIDSQKIIWSYHEEDKELGFYKFYYHLIHKWIGEYNNYKIFLDAKKNKKINRVAMLEQVLQNRFRYDDLLIKQVQALPSKEVVLIQLADLFLGSISAKLNNIPLTNSAKIDFIKQIEQRLGKKIAPTYANENKFNIFKITLQGQL